MAQRKHVDYSTHHPIHDEVFGVDPDGMYNDTPPGAIGTNVNLI